MHKAAFKIYQRITLNPFLHFDMTQPGGLASPETALPLPLVQGRLIGVRNVKRYSNASIKASFAH